MEQQPNTVLIESVKRIALAHTPELVGVWRYYSVLLPLVDKGGVLYVLYELRSPDMDVQPGEVSFPGGSIEKGEGPKAAALRETVEELGIPAGSIEVVTELDYLINYSNSKLYCFLGVIDAAALETANINRDEVAEYFLVPLSWLLETDPDVYVNRLVTQPVEGLPVEKLAPNGNYKWRTGESTVPVYLWPDPVTGAERVIWGMTARLTMAFVEMLRGGTA